MSEAGFTRVSLLDACAPTRAFSPLRPRAVGATVATPTVEPDHFAAGFAEGERASSAAFAPERAALQRLIVTAEALQAEPSEELAAMIAVTVERLVTELVGAMPVERTWLAGRIDSALACIDAADAARTLWLHPDDAALLGDVELPLDMQTDASLERGALRIDCSLGWVEDSRSRHLDDLRATLGIEIQP